MNKKIKRPNRAARAKAKHNQRRGRRDHREKKTNPRKFDWVTQRTSELADRDKELAKNGWYMHDIKGDGNCMFRALSDQYYGHQEQHEAIRRKVCDFLRENKDEYQCFVEDDQDFDEYVDEMQNDGCFGGNMELVAFARLECVYIKIYQPGYIYCIGGVDDIDGEDKTKEKRPMLYIAFDGLGHYNSIRNIDGPSTGLPEIKDPDLGDDAENKQDRDKTFDTKEKIILSAYPDTELDTIQRLLDENEGDTDKVIDLLAEIDSHEAVTEHEKVDDADSLHQTTKKDGENHSDEDHSDGEHIDTVSEETIKQGQQETGVPKKKKKRGTARQRKLQARKERNERLQQLAEAKKNETVDLNDTMKRLHI